MKPLYTADEILYSASALCTCGAGLAYPLDHNEARRVRAWVCSRVLLGEVALVSLEMPRRLPNAPMAPERYTDTAGLEHSRYPFAFWNIKSEGQPSAHGQSTRPPGAHLEWEPLCNCRACGYEFVAARRRPVDDARFGGLDCPSCGQAYESANGTTLVGVGVLLKSVVVHDKVIAA